MSGAGVLAAALSETPRRRRAAVRPELPRDFAVYGLPPAEASGLRDALARAGVAVDPETDEDTVRVASGENEGVTLERLLSPVSEWVAPARFRRLPIAYGSGTCVLELREPGEAAATCSGRRSARG